MNARSEIICPKCNQRTQMLVGQVAFASELDAKNKCFSVCWECGLRAEHAPPWDDLEFEDFPPAGLDKSDWIKHTEHHWQMTLDGSLLDYWPSKRKWRWRGVTQVGDVDEFIAGAMGELE